MPPLRPSPLRLACMYVMKNENKKKSKNGQDQTGCWKIAHSSAHLSELDGALHSVHWGTFMGTGNDNGELG